MIDNIIKYKPTVYKTEGVSNYKVKLFNFNEFSINTSHEAKFEMLMRNEHVEFVKTNYTKSLIIYKLCNISNLQVDKLVNSTLFDLAEEFVPMPHISINLDILNKKDSIEKILTSAKYLDSIDKKNNKFSISDIIIGYSYQNSTKKINFSYDGLSNLTSINSNSVQGWNMNSGFNFQKKYTEKNNKKT